MNKEKRPTTFSVKQVGGEYKPKELMTVKEMQEILKRIMNMAKTNE